MTVKKDVLCFRDVKIFLFYVFVSQSSIVSYFIFADVSFQQ